MVALREPSTRSWFDPRSAGALARELGSRLAARFAGTPGLFVTLTYERGAYSSPLELFRAQQDERHVRRFIERLSHALGESLTGRWIRKLEFHEDGWPHWHLLLDWPHRIDHEIVAECWGHGFVNVRRVTPERCHYFAKYIAKSGALPAWVMHLRLRELKVVATSPGFWRERSMVEREWRPPTGPREPWPYVPLGERLQGWLQPVRVVVRSESRKHFRTFDVPLVRAVTALELAARASGKRAVSGSDGRWHLLSLTYREALDVLASEVETIEAERRADAREAGGQRAATLNSTTVRNPPEGGDGRGAPAWWPDWLLSLGLAEWEVVAE